MPRSATEEVQWSWRVCLRVAVHAVLPPLARRPSGLPLRRLSIVVGDAFHERGVEIPDAMNVARVERMIVEACSWWNERSRRLALDAGLDVGPDAAGPARGGVFAWRMPPNAAVHACVDDADAAELGPEYVRDHGLVVHAQSAFDARVPGVVELTPEAVFGAAHGAALGAKVRQSACGACGAAPAGS